MAKLIDFILIAIVFIGDALSISPRRSRGESGRAAIRNP